MGTRVIYLDSGATAQIPQSVIDRVVEHMTQRNGNPHRGSHILLLKHLKTMKMLEIVVEFINAREREEVVFTRGRVQNLWTWLPVAMVFIMWKRWQDCHYCWGTSCQSCNMAMWQDKQGNFLEYACTLDEHEHLKMVKSIKLMKTLKLLPLAHVSNVLGMEFPCKELTESAFCRCYSSPSMVLYLTS